MKLSKRDISDALSLFLSGAGARFLGFLAIYILARDLTVEHFAWWQVSKAAFSYVLIFMEAGFLFHVTLLMQKQGFSLSSVRRRVFVHRAQILLLSLPFLYGYFLIIDLPLWYIVWIFPLLVVSVFDYEGICIGAGKGVYTGVARLVRNLTIVIGVLVFLGFHYSAIAPVLATTLGAALSGLILYRVVVRSGADSQGRTYKEGLFSALRNSRHFLLLQIMQTSMQNADLVIAGFFLQASEIAHYAVSLLVAELILFPVYTVQKIIQAKYARSPEFKVLGGLAALFFVLTVLLLLLHARFMLSAYGYFFPQFDASLLHALVGVLFFYALLRSLNVFLQLHFNTVGQEKVVSTSTAVGGVTNIGMNAILIPLFGLLVIPWITVFAELVILLVTVALYTYRYRRTRKILRGVH